MKVVNNIVRQKYGHTRQACAMEMYFKKQELRNKILSAEGLPQD